ncbi:MAG: hydrogenase formation protein HypD, partial [Candidatus Bipolaricaulota bacterium]|nr:hydrogenase formation protein HypD [Candidatus Bipolaricaulota bacterium]
MKFASEFRQGKLAQGLLSKIRGASKRPARFMEFCGGHTVTIFRYGIRQALPETITMLSGPGCPICVTSNADLDKAIALARIPGLIIATFGDAIRVPGSHTSLQVARAEGADVRIVYSTLDALRIAEENPGRKVVFLGIGFETTAPTIAASVLQAKEDGLANYSVLSLHKLCPPVIKALLDSGEVVLDGFVCPGHVSAITGSKAWEFIAHDYGISCVVAGFEPLDVLQSIDMLVAQVEREEPKVEIAYRRGVQPEGNTEALRLMAEIFEPCSSEWRGMGTIPNSGLRIKNAYGHFDAEKVFEIDPGPTREPVGCICGEIL